MRGFIGRMVARQRSTTRPCAVHPIAALQTEYSLFSRDVEQKTLPVARGIGCTPAQLALAWLLRRNPDVVPIPGTKRLRYLEENAAAVEIEPAEAQLDAVDSAVPADAVRGMRYPTTAYLES